MLSLKFILLKNKKFIRFLIYVNKKKLIRVLSDFVNDVMVYGDFVLFTLTFDVFPVNSQILCLLFAYVNLKKQFKQVKINIV